MRAILTHTVLGLAVAALSITVGLLVTPAQEVSAAGQIIEVDVVPPTWALSGPGELDLFGQRIPTKIHFTGPVRPRLRLTHITLSQQLSEFAQPNSSRDQVNELEGALTSGFRRYFYWQITIVGLVSILLVGAIAGWLRRPRKHTVVLIATGLVLTEALNIGAVMVTAFSTPEKLSHVDSLQSLVGNAPQLQVPAVQRPPSGPPGDAVVVLGDSTAAGLGNRPVRDPSPTDIACQRSRDSYAETLARVRETKVTNLACSGATIASGLLGEQHVGGETIPPQMADPAVRRAGTIIVSVGANDLRWSNLLLVCAISVSCTNNVEEAAFQQLLAKFSRDYLQLLSELQLLPNHPTVLINLYFDPFGSDVECLASVGVTADKQVAMVERLTAMNHILSEGATAASFLTASPDFDEHGVCSLAPYVQGVDAAAPFHPTAAGELAIAFADEHALTTSK